ncbi:uncharacterized protein LOC113325318 isoform X2 [Papaver somniferum]|uniref:uncharacterized protein LOC113325318 isoform X2 n=1 Tax=Papaver somniferum TaxID=3469 RepID=UPI000E702C63|nr:uncharacterized protein LOC113325318 isoform X2 [Papaver somniferum]
MSEEPRSKHKKLDRKVKFAVGKAKVSNKGFEGIENPTKKKENSKYERNFSRSDAQVNINGENKFSRSNSRDTKFLRLTTEKPGFNSKRVYGDRDINEEGNRNKSFTPRKGWKNFDDDDRKKLYGKKNSEREGFGQGGNTRRDGNGDSKFGGRSSLNRVEGRFRNEEGSDNNRIREFRSSRGDAGSDNSSFDGKRSSRRVESKFRNDDGNDNRFRSREKPAFKRVAVRGELGGRSYPNRVEGRFRNEEDSDGNNREFRSSRGDVGSENSSFRGKRSSGRVESRLRNDDVNDNKLWSREKPTFKRVATRAEGGKDGFKNKKQVIEKYGNKQQAEAAESLQKAEKRFLRYKKDKENAAEARVVKPKKKKMGIHSLDISNKRTDDSVSADGDTVEKKVDAQKDVELSQNAQFRAIQPSPSILKFVEDNFLGRRRLVEFQRAGYNIELPAPLDNVPFSTSTERERIEESAFRNKLDFFAAAKVSSSFPPVDLPEIAFAGRSNVGKSSLLNALTRQWGVVRTSDKPGHTQTINFFNLGKKLALVDLPGYGFAYAKEEVKDAWEELVQEYVSTRVGLKRVCLLIDTKWGMKPRDHELIDLMERSETNYQIVLTKTDVVFPIDVARRAMQIENTLKANKSLVQPVMMILIGLDFALDK